MKIVKRIDLKVALAFIIISNEKFKVNNYCERIKNERFIEVARY